MRKIRVPTLKEFLTTRILPCWGIGVPYVFANARMDVASDAAGLKEAGSA